MHDQTQNDAPPSPFTHGIMVMTQDGRVVHFVGLWQPPTVATFEQLEAELNVEPIFGLAGRIGVDAFLVEAPEAVVSYMRAQHCLGLTVKA